MSAPLTPRPAGMPCWFELGGPADPAVLDHWAATLGWEYDTNAHVGGYRRGHAGGAKVCGFGGPLEPITPRGWRVYLHVDDLDATLAHATALGATQVHPVTAAGPDGRFAWLLDPQGCATGLFQPDDDPGTARERGPGRVAGWTLESRLPEATAAFYAALFPGFTDHVRITAGDQDWVVEIASGRDGDATDPAGNRLRLARA